MNEKNVLYVCDRRRCEKCNEECIYTTDINHAKNFTKDFAGHFVEDNSKYIKVDDEILRRLENGTSKAN